MVDEWRLAGYSFSDEPSFLKRGYYIDKSFSCRDCGREEVWTATQQKWWYEIARGDVNTTATRCRACRRLERERRTEARRVHLEGLARKHRKDLTPPPPAMNTPSGKWRVMTSSEAKRWVKAQGLPYDLNPHRLPSWTRFELKPKSFPAAQEAILAICREAGQVLLVLERQPLDGEWSALHALRAQHGEHRPLSAAPAHLLRTRHSDLLQQVLEVCLVPGNFHSVHLYFAPTKSTLLVWEMDLVFLWTDRHTDRAHLRKALPES